MKVFLDDVRDPYPGWTLVRNYQECIRLLRTGKVRFLSLDHDLGLDRKSGYDVACWIERQVVLEGFRPPVLSCHSANPAGRRNILAAIESIRRLTPSPLSGTVQEGA